jgi:phosphate uptake regulator
MERHHFQQELSALKERLLAMGGLAEERVRTAMQGLVERDGDLIDEVLNGDMPLNELHIDIDDAELGKNVKAAFSAGDFDLGGLIAKSASKSLRIDLTYDASFEDVSGKFGEISGFGV